MQASTVAELEQIPGDSRADISMKNQYQSTKDSVLISTDLLLAFFALVYFLTPMFSVLFIFLFLAYMDFDTKKKNFI